MKVPLVLRAAPLAVAFLSSPALAQPKASPASTPARDPSRDAAYGYIFPDDPLAAGGFDATDVQIRVIRHAMRTTLIRLRTDFLPEMIVSVEKL
jgi:hypothetical protein